jgi:hypothetical protein
MVDWTSVGNQVVLALVGLGGSIIVLSLTNWYNNLWRRKEEVSQIRKSVMENFEKSVKSSIILMDVLVARIVFEYSTFEQRQNTRKYLLNDLIPFLYVFDSVEDGFPASKVKSEVFVDFPAGNKPLLQKFENEFKDYKNKMYENRLLMSKFHSGLSQYYVNSRILNNEVDELVAYINITYVLTLKILNANDMEEFASLLDIYKKTTTILFHQMATFEKNFQQRK